MKTSVSDPDWIRIQSGQWIWIRISIQPKMLDPDRYPIQTHLARPPAR
jgi:hypothetical protein